MTNQQRILMGLPLSHGEGYRTRYLEHQPKFVLNMAGIATHRLPTVRFRSLPKSMRLGRRQYLRSEARFQKVTEKRINKEIHDEHQGN